jgi:hypothetical protein
MNVVVKLLECQECGSSVVAPANFCDMCGVKLKGVSLAQPIISSYQNEQESPKNIQPLLTDKNKNLAIKIGIPALIVAAGLYMLLSKNPGLHFLLFFLFPAMIWTIIGIANVGEVNAAIERFYSWILNKLEKVKEGAGKRHKYFFKPWHWMLSQIDILETKIEKPEVRTGFKVAAYLYICFLMIFIAYIAVSIVVGIILLAIVFWIIDFFSDNQGTVRRKETYARGIKKDRLEYIFPFGSTELEKLKQKFGSDFGELRNNGEIYTKGAFPVKIGYIDENGTVYDTRGLLIEKRGYVDEDGRVS